MAFIVFEGVDGSGKSTLIDRLSHYLRDEGRDIVLTREPGGTPLAEELRRVLIRTDGEIPSPRTELLLYEAGRAQHVERVIRPALVSGKWVLCDRFTASTIAFQGAARGLDYTEIDRLNNFAVQDVKPHLMVLLDLPVEVSLARRQARTDGTGVAADRFEREKMAFHEAVRQSYLVQAKAQPEQWLKLDARKSPDELFADLLSALRQRGLVRT